MCVFVVRTCRRRTRCITLASAVSVSHSAFLGRGCAKVKPRGLENEKAYQQVSSWRGKKKLQGPFLPTKWTPKAFVSRCPWTLDKDTSVLGCCPPSPHRS
ncbi:unnamed protein product [Rangifer tarandus platyrhynchus]|uniref:Secreted protein n=2 Tax=Rangifer tarandus platyrhynchus TaxID=3082113 RepID=A0ABN8ZXX8_RANTA|nr:unnamed protein product [Rangifer tarandus platyrhynchus]